MNKQSIAPTTPGRFDNFQRTSSSAQAMQQVGQYPNDGHKKTTASAVPQPDRWASIPQELRDRPQWCLANADKRPLTVDGRAASVTDPKTWNDFATVARAAVKKMMHIGYVISASDPYTCIDLDVKDNTPQDCLDRFWVIATAFDTYCEASCSGRGLHVWLKGKIGGAGIHREGVECYDAGRWMICTGNVVIQKPIACRQEMLNVLISEIRSGTQPGYIELAEVAEIETDAIIWKRARDAGNNQKFISLCQGNWMELQYPSQSEADFALLSMFCFYTRSNEQVRRMFRQTKLGERHKTTKNDIYVNRGLRSIRDRQAGEDATTAIADGLVAQLLQQLQVSEVRP